MLLLYMLSLYMLTIHVLGWSRPLPYVFRDASEVSGKGAHIIPALPL